MAALDTFAARSELTVGGTTYEILRLGALQEREFRLFFTGQLVSLLGDAVTPFALAWAVLDLTGSARDLGFVIAAKTAPLVVFLLVDLTNMVLDPRRRPGVLAKGA